MEGLDAGIRPDIAAYNYIELNIILAMVQFSALPRALVSIDSIWHKL